MQSVVITGTSTGIGYAAAKVLLAKGFRVFGSVRKAADADRLKVELGPSFKALLFDVTDEAAVAAAAREVRDQLNGETLAGLVNNAGVAVAGPALDVPLDDFRRQIDVNVMGPVIVSQAFGPLLGIDRSLRGPPGRIIMISSVAGRSGSPLNAPYALSKHALEGFSESLRRELMMFGIDVVIIGPGPIKTAIWEKAEQLDINAFGNSPFMPALQRVRTIMLAFGANGLPAERVGALIHKALTTPRPRVRYAIVPNPLQMLVVRLLPKRVVDRVMAKRLGLTAPRD